MTWGPWGVTPTGFPYPSQGQLLDKMLSDLTGLPNLGSVRIAPESRAYNLYAPVSQIAALCWEGLAGIYLSLSRDSATGVSLDSRIALIGKAKYLQKRSTVFLVLSNTTSETPVPIPIGSQAAQQFTGVLWETTSEATIPGLSTLISGAEVDSLEWFTPNTVRASFTGIDLSTVAVGDEITVSNSDNASNDGTFPISALDADAGWVEYSNPDRTDDTDDESPSGAQADIVDVEATVQVSAQSIEYGPFVASPGSINIINTPLSGWDAVTNPDDAKPGRLTEKDDEVRVRTAGETSSSQGGTSLALKNKLKAEGASYVTISENRTDEEVDGLPPHSIHVTIVGLTDQEIVDIIGKYGPTADTYGSTSGSYIDDEGVVSTVFFSRVTPVYPYYGVELGIDAAVYPDGLSDEDKAIVKAALAAVEHTHGQDLINHRLGAAVSNCGLAGLLTITVKQSLSASPSATTNITIPATEVVVADLSRITVTAI